jgi:DNA-binding transcriptional regulator/RsmH inhibitor MraZ
MVTGVLTRIEIWDTTRWREHKAAGRTSLQDAGRSGFGI